MFYILNTRRYFQHVFDAAPLFKSCKYVLQHMTQKIENRSYSWTDSSVKIIPNFLEIIVRPSWFSRLQLQECNTSYPDITSWGWILSFYQFRGIVPLIRFVFLELFNSDINLLHVDIPRSQSFMLYKNLV